MCRAEMEIRRKEEGGEQQDMKGWKVIGRGGKFKSDN